MIDAPMNRLSSFSRVRTDSAAGFIGLLGYIVIDQESSEAIAITSITVASKELQLVDCETTISRPSVLNETTDVVQDERSVGTLLTFALLRQDLYLDEFRISDANGRALETTDVVDDLLQYSGDLVLIHTATSNPRVARMSSTRSSFKMPDYETSVMTLFTGAIELRSLNQAPLAKYGDGGAIVTTQDGQAIGVVVCAVGLLCFAAPIDTAMEQIGNTKPLNSESIGEYNLMLKEVQLEAPIVELDDEDLAKFNDLEVRISEILYENDDTQTLLALASKATTTFFEE